MPALTREELEARKRARNSRIMESRVDRMALVQDTTADRVTMPEEYYREPQSRGVSSLGVANNRGLEHRDPPGMSSWTQCCTVT